MGLFNNSNGAGGTSDLAQQRALMYGLTLEPLFLKADAFYVAELTPAPNSTASGAAILALDKDTNQLAVAVTAEGLEANRPHIQHIHGFANGRDAINPTLAQADADRDGYIEGAEGGPFWGPVLLDMPTQTPADDDFLVVQTFQLPQQGLGADPQLDLRVYNIHGFSTPQGAGAGTPGEVNGVGGYKFGLVATGGEIEQVGSARELREFISDTDFAQAAIDDLAERLSARLFSGWFA